MPIPPQQSNVLHSIEFKAGVNNSLILTAEEDDLARARISELVAKLHDLQQEIVDVSASLERFRVAVAPHKRLPLEVLQHIFMLTIPTNGRVLLPRSSQESTTPWSLRSVCSHWRALVLGMPALWGTIFLRNDDTVYPEERSCLPHHLPPTGPLVFSMVSDLKDSSTELLKALVIPNISRLRGLHLDVPFSTLHTFFHISRGVPQIQCLTSLSLTLVHGSTCWNNPSLLLAFFERLVNLTSLTLECSGSTPGLLLSDARFPAEGINHLTLDVSPEISIENIEEFLTRFSKLQTLAVLHVRGWSWSLELESLVIPLNLPHLRSLKLADNYIGVKDNVSSFGSSKVKSTRPLNIAWSTLYDLDISSLKSDMSILCGILRQCTALMNFSAAFGTFVSEGSTMTTTTLDIITLPMLSTMKLKLADGYLLDRLLVPKLRYLEVSHSHLMPSHEPPLIVPEIASMLSRSGCVLLTLSLSGTIPPTDGNAMQELLMLVPYLIKFTLEDQEIDEGIAERIDAEELLPHVTADDLCLYHE